MAAQPIVIGCRDGCGTQIELTPEQVEPPGWTWLPIQKRWRCPTCATALEQANDQPVA